MNSLLTPLVELAMRRLDLMPASIVSRRSKADDQDLVFQREDSLFERWKISIQTLDSEEIYINWQFAIDFLRSCPIPSGPLGSYGRIDDLDGLSDRMRARHLTAGWFAIGRNNKSVMDLIGPFLEAFEGPFRCEVNKLATQLLENPLLREASELCANYVVRGITPCHDEVMRELGRSEKWASFFGDLEAVSSEIIARIQGACASKRDNP